jgi:hypothetical protein
VEIVSAGVKSAITSPLNDNQFSALVSFAYNVGLGSFRSSSVLRSVNACRFDRVPADLALWVKAGGKVLPGLIRRRAAEAALFLADDPSAGFATADQGAAKSNTSQTGRGIEPLPETLHQPSHINLAAALSGVGGFISSASHHLEDWIGHRASLSLEIAAMMVVMAAVFWIIHEHRRATAQRPSDGRTPSGIPAML